jgi:hypothetical protein
MSILLTSFPFSFLPANYYTKKRLPAQEKSAGFGKIFPKSALGNFLDRGFG